jgi:hypothetical protein
MGLPRPALLATLLCLSGLPVAACGSGSEDGLTGDGASPSDQATSLAFVPGEVLRLLPLAKADINLAAGPPAPYVVRFALLPDRPNAEPNDASLDRAEIVTDARGVGTISLTAPSTPSTFTVRAAIGDLEALLPVAVSDKGYASVIAEPVYAGARPVETWVASVRVGTSCADLSGFPPPDGALVATSAAEHSPRIDSIPAGPVASVSVRSGAFAYGCTNLPDLGTDEVRKVQVTVADRPLQLAGELALSLAISETSSEWTTLLSQATTRALAAFRAGTTSDVVLLLDGMQGASSDPPAFAENRAAHDFHDVVAAVLPEQHLTQRVQSWMNAGVTALGPLAGELELRTSSASFRLTSAGGVPATDSGFLGSSTWSAFGNPGDTLVLGGSLSFLVSRWVVALADRPALQQFTSATDAAEALVRVADCQLIGANLAAAAGGQVSPGCDAECAEHLCEAALVGAWARAADADNELTRLSVGVTGQAFVDEQARPVSLEGTWLGTLAGPASAVGGPATAETP